MVLVQQAATRTADLVLAALAAAQLMEARPAPTYPQSTRGLPAAAPLPEPPAVLAAPQAPPVLRVQTEREEVAAVVHRIRPLELEAREAPVSAIGELLVRVAVAAVELQPELARPALAGLQALTAAAAAVQDLLPPAETLVVRAPRGFWLSPTRLLLILPRLVAEAIQAPSHAPRRSVTTRKAF